MGTLVKTNIGDFYVPGLSPQGYCEERVECSCGHGYCSCFDGFCAYCRTKKEAASYERWRNVQYPIKNHKCASCDKNLYCLFSGR